MNTSASAPVFIFAFTLAVLPARSTWSRRRATRAY